VLWRGLAVGLPVDGLQPHYLHQSPDPFAVNLKPQDRLLVWPLYIWYSVDWIKQPLRQPWGIGPKLPWAIAGKLSLSMVRVYGAFMGANYLGYIWWRLMLKGLAQGDREQGRRIDGSPGLLAQLELEGHLITGDARYAQRGLSGQVVDPRQVGVVSTSG
jgi:hypothetical protein